MKKIIVVPVLGVCSVLFLGALFFVSPSDRVIADEPALPVARQAAPLSSIDLKNAESFPAEDAKGTVVLVLQTHRAPGSAVEADVNDGPVVVQREIDTILERLHNVYGLNTVLVEGEVFGADVREKVDALEERLMLGTLLASSIVSLEDELTAVNVHTPKVLQDMKRFLADYERETILTGAPYLLGARHESVALLGVEDKDLQAKSAEMVRAYLYENDRISALEQVATGDPVVEPASLSRLARLRQASSSTSGRAQTIPETQAALERLAVGEEDRPTLLAAIRNVEDTFARMSVVDRVPQELSVAPSRADNPYNVITDLDALKTTRKSTEARMRGVVVDERNAMIAKNTATVMVERKLASAVLVFGIGHKEGLVKELNDQGLSVITITPESLVD